MTPPATETISEPRTQDLKSRSQTWLGQRTACRDHQPEMIQPPAVFPATVVGRNEASGLLELEMDDSPGAIMLAAIAMLPQPSFVGGERVLVMPGPIDPIHERNTWFVTAVIEMAAKPPRLLPNDQRENSWTLSDGTRVQRDPLGESVELRDASNRLCFRYDSHDQSVTIAASIR